MYYDKTGSLAITYLPAAYCGRQSGSDCKVLTIVGLQITIQEGNTTTSFSLCLIWKLKSGSVKYCFPFLNIGTDVKDTCLYTIMLFVKKGDD